MRRDFEEIRYIYLCQRWDELDMTVMMWLRAHGLPLPITATCCLENTGARKGKTDLFMCAWSARSKRSKEESAVCLR